MKASMNGLKGMINKKFFGKKLKKGKKKTPVVDADKDSM